MWAELLINGQQISIQCQQNESIENVYTRCLSKFCQKPDLDSVNFLYNGKIAQPSMTLNQVMNPYDKNRNRLSIIVNKNDDGFVKHKNVICPECLEPILFECRNFKFYLKCDNGHVFNNLSAKEFNKLQEIEPSRIICDICGEKNIGDWGGESFTQCLECKKKICSWECQEKHLENIGKKRKSKHSIVHYSIEKNNLCIEHKKEFKKVCEKCEKDLCDECVERHQCLGDKVRKNYSKNKNIKGKYKEYKEYKEYNQEIKEIIKKNENLIKVQKEFNDKINLMILHLNDVKRNLNSFIETNTDLLEKFKNSNTFNYKMMKNIRAINIQQTLDDIKYINQNENMINQFHDIVNLSRRMKYADELTLKYRIKLSDECESVKIFSNEFVRNNKDNCKLIVNNREIELKSELDINKYFPDRPSTITIRLKLINPITNMKNAFKNTDLISAPDLSKFDTSKVETFEGTFRNCRHLQNLPQLEWDMKNVKSTSYMFSGCSKLQNLNLQNWKMENNKDMSYMFLDNISLKSIKGLDNFVTNNVKNMEFIFSGCKSLDKMENISHWNTQNLENMGGMFKGCNSLTQIPDISKWNTSKVKDIHEIFCGCQSLTSLPDISLWNTESITEMCGAFCGCTSITSLPDISKWKLNGIKSMENLFANCLGLLEIPDISCWDLSKTVDISKIFYNCFSLRDLPKINCWNVSNVEFMNEVFSKCKNLQVFPDISNWDTSNVMQMEKLFNECSEVSYLPDISKWVTQKVTNMNSLFNECCNLISLPNIALWETNNLTEIKSMFRQCGTLISIPDISKWDVSNITSMKAIFSGCKNIENFPDFSQWDMKNVRDLSFMFYGCDSLKNLPDISKWKLSKKVKKNEMFNKNFDNIHEQQLGMNLINLNNLDEKKLKICQNLGLGINFGY